MKPWKIVLIPTAIMLVIASIYIFTVWKKRQSPGVVNQGQEQQLTSDDVAVVRREFPQHFEDLKDMEGKSVWMKNGYTMPYFAYAGGKVDFKKRAGVIPPDQKLGNNTLDGLRSKSEDGEAVTGWHYTGREN